MSGANGNQPQLPKDAAKLVLWFDGLSQPTGFLVKKDAAERALQLFSDGVGLIEFESYPDGSGMKSVSAFSCEMIRGVSIEYATFQLSVIPPGGLHG